MVLAGASARGARGEVAGGGTGRGRAGERDAVELKRMARASFFFVTHADGRETLTSLRLLTPAQCGKLGGMLALLGLVDRTVRMPGRGDARVNCKQRNQFTAQPPAALPAFAATPRPSFSYRASRTRVPAAGQREGVAEADLAGSTSLSPG